MIAIPNMGMPENCDMCPIEGCEYINGKFTCPLIDIVRCGECVKANTKDCSHSYWDDDWGEWRIGYKDDDWFCADGERRSE